ncbi:MAG: tail fiber domain-containing protein [Bacteroidota bacterium]
MRPKIILLALAAFFALIVSSPITAQNIVEDVQTTPEEKAVKLSSQASDSYLIELAGPNGYYWKEKISNVTDLIFNAHQPDGEPYADGLYRVQVTPIYSLTEAQRAALLDMRNAGDQKAIAEFRAKNNLPEKVNVGMINFSVRNGKFVAPNQREEGIKMPSTSSQWEMDHPSMYAAINYMSTSIPDRAMDDDPTRMDAQVFATDLIVQGSTCLGIDCTTTESFGFDTQRLKENNLRLHFDDTSASASFPGNDWRIVINDSSNGGDNYFAIEDATAGRVPFRIIAGAPANSFYMNAAGDVGIGNSNPVLELHITDGDSPSIRLEQNGSAGFGTQSWDLAGNETNFFIRDVNNSSSLPFRLRPGAPSNSIYIDQQGDIGLGTENPGDNALQVEAGDVYVKAGNLGVNVVPTVALDVVGQSQFTGASLFTGDMSAFLTTGASFVSASSFATVLRIDATNTRVGIGKSNPDHLLELSADDAFKPNGGTWGAASDRRLKTNIKDFTDGLDAILKIRPVTYNYNGKMELPTDKEFVGIIAQEMQEIAPYTITNLNPDAAEGEEKYLAFDGTPVTYMLINAVQEQQELIDAQKEEIAQLKAQLSEVNELKATVAELSNWMKKQEDAASAEVETEDASTTGDKE